MASQTFSAQQAMEIVGLTYRQIDHWVRSGYLEPQTPAKGSGTRREFSEDDLYSLSLAKTLSSGGVALADAFELIEDLRHLEEVAENKWIVISDGEPKIIQFDDADANHTYRSTFKNGKVITAINLSDVHADLENSIADFNRTNTHAFER